MSVDVLIIEPDYLNRRFLADALQANGYSTAVAKDVGEARTACSQQATGLVLVEPCVFRNADESTMEMTRLLDKILTMGRVPVIAVTASGGTGGDRLTERWCADQLSKPTRLEEILKIIESKIGPGRV